MNTTLWWILFAIVATVWGAAVALLVLGASVAAFWMFLGTSAAWLALAIERLALARREGS